MQTFNLNYHKNGTLIFFILLVPTVTAGFILFILLNLSLQISEYILIIIVAISFLLMFFALQWLVNNKIIIPCEVSLGSEGLFFQLKKSSFLYSTKNFFACWGDVNGVSEIFCSKTGIYFYRITFNNPNLTANFSAIRNNENEAEKFYNELSYHQFKFA